MSDGFTWLRHPETGGHFRCPAPAVADWLAMGWQHSEAPEEPNPVIAEHIARSAPPAETKPTIKPARSARRGETQEK